MEGQEPCRGVFPWIQVADTAETERSCHHHNQTNEPHMCRTQRNAGSPRELQARLPTNSRETWLKRNCCSKEDKKSGILVRRPRVQRRIGHTSGTTCSRRSVPQATGRYNADRKH